MPSCRLVHHVEQLSWPRAGIYSAGSRLAEIVAPHHDRYLHLLLWIPLGPQASWRACAMGHIMLQGRNFSPPLNTFPVCTSPTFPLLSNRSTSTARSAGGLPERRGSPLSVRRSVETNADSQWSASGRCGQADVVWSVLRSDRRVRGCRSCRRRVRGSSCVVIAQWSVRTSRRRVVVTATRRGGNWCGS